MKWGRGVASPLGFLVSLLRRDARLACGVASPPGGETNSPCGGAVTRREKVAPPPGGPTNPFAVDRAVPGETTPAAGEATPWLGVVSPLLGVVSPWHGGAKSALTCLRRPDIRQSGTREPFSGARAKLAQSNSSAQRGASPRALKIDQ